MSNVMKQKSGSVVVVEDSQGFADIFQLPLNVTKRSSCQPESGTNLGWLSSLRLPLDDVHSEGYLRER